MGSYKVSCFFLKGNVRATLHLNTTHQLLHVGFGDSGRPPRSGGGGGAHSGAGAGSGEGRPERQADASAAPGRNRCACLLYFCGHHAGDIRLATWLVGQQVQ